MLKMHAYMQAGETERFVKGYTFQSLWNRWRNITRSQAL